MNTDHWLALWHDSILRKYLACLAWACSHDEHVNRDLLATAWIAIGDCLPDTAPEWAMHVGAMAMMGRYKDCYRTKAKRRWNDDPVRKRTWRVTKKYYCVVSYPPLLICDNRG